MLMEAGIKENERHEQAVCSEENGKIGRLDTCFLGDFPLDLAELWAIYHATNVEKNMGFEKVENSI